MLFRTSLEQGLSAMTAGEELKTNPVIMSVAGVLALKDTGHVLCDKTVGTLAETLAEFGERHGVDSLTLQYALQAAEPGLSEAGAERPGTY